jgi:hypothetical protein
VILTAEETSARPTLLFTDETARAINIISKTPKISTLSSKNDEK